MKSCFKFRWKKVGISIIGYYLMLTINTFCSCPDPRLPYFDFKSIDVKVYPPAPILLYPDLGFGFTIRFTEIEYVAKEIPKKSISGGLINSALADCDGNGDWGSKYGLSSINIYADSTFDSTIPIGEPISKLFEVSVYYNNATKQYEKIGLEDIEEYPFKLSNGIDISISSNSKPVTLNRAYHFNIEVIKENGDTITSTVGPLVWKN